MKSFLGPQLSKSRKYAEKVVQLQIQTISHDRKNNSGGRKKKCERAEPHTAITGEQI